MSPGHPEATGEPADRAPSAASRSRSGPPRRIGAALGEVVSRSEPQTVLAKVQTAWARAAGQSVADRARPVAERDGTVTVACVSATWAQELDLMQLELLSRLNDGLEATAIEALRFVVDGESQGY